MGQDLAIAVPAAVGGCTATSWVVFADLAEDLPLAILMQVQLQVRVALAVTWHETKTPHSMDLNEGKVKLIERNKYLVVDQNVQRISIKTCFFVFVLI